MLGSTAVWPPLPPEQRRQAEEASLARELEWLLDSLQDTLASLKAGLEECAALLSPAQDASTLALSTPRSESLKGYVTRLGSRIVKGDVHLRLQTLPVPRGAASYKLSIATAPEAPVLVLAQLTVARDLINACLDIIDVSAWTGDRRNARFIAGQLRLLFDHMEEAKQTLNGGAPHEDRWWSHPMDDDILTPPCPPNVSVHFTVVDAALAVHVRTLEPAAPPGAAESLTGLGLRERFAVALGAARPAAHDETDRTFAYRGREVRVREKVRVDSQDPRLLAAMAKLSALAHSVAVSSRALATVMGEES